MLLVLKYCRKCFQVHFRAVSDNLNLLAGIFHIHLAGQSVIFWHCSVSPLPHLFNAARWALTLQKMLLQQACVELTFSSLWRWTAGMMLISAAGNAGTALAVLSAGAGGGGRLSAPSLLAKTASRLILWEKWIQHCNPATEGVFAGPKMSVRGKK